MTTIDPALNPDLGNIRSRERPLSKEEQLQRSRAMCALQGDPRIPSCSGNLFVGLFFDGTGNNEDADYKKYTNDPRHQKHSNVVRLYHAYPERHVDGTNKYYRYYVPGVGTEFKQIGDSGTTLGSATAWGGAPRIIWGLTQILNAIHAYFFKVGLIPDDEAKELSNRLGGAIYGADQRRKQFKAYQERLKAKIRGLKPELMQINLSVFGFSRGAAQARAFVNWLYELCEQDGKVWRFAGVPLRVQFLGIFDTVASVGAAGLYSILEGRQDWADNTMQVHPEVEQCLHFVAGHEVRACFPLDSVRINGKYPANCKEYVFPGSHSDVGGGYMPRALGTADWSDQGAGQDLQLPRIPCYEMYLAAVAAGVPFRSREALTKLDAEKIFAAMVPSQATIDAFIAYYQNAGIKSAPVEDMARQHMSWYFNHRWKSLEAGFHSAPQYRRACTKPNFDQGDDYKDEPTWLLHTQRALIQIIANACHMLEQRMQLNRQEVEQAGEVLESPFIPTKSTKEKLLLVTLPLTKTAGVKLLVDERNRPLKDEALQPKADAIAKQAPAVLARWRQWLAQNNYPEVHDARAPERDIIRLLEALRSSPIPPPIRTFFDTHVHDSMAGFIGFGMPEFQTNGYGIAKFRRIYFGNDGDKMIRDQVATDNAQRIAEARGRRNQAAAERMPPRVPPMGEWAWPR